MRFVICLFAVLFTGCSLLPVKRTFPDVPESLMQKCTPLKETPPTEKLSEVLKVVVANYGEYHTCSGRVDAWQKWYNEQKKIFNEVK